ncbi:MAG: alcohol dehydrogenase catalytic domain-containing protein [archaeon]|nr:alcohol dehydrogenase catalytic domain-containing protein [archaeon]
MKAAVFDGKKLSIEEVPIPELKPNQALIKVKKAGICGTDIAILEGHLPTPIPIIPGHEFSGVVEKIGTKMKESWIGQRVTCEINSDICGKCYYCKHGILTNCIERKALGIDTNGAFAEYIAVDDYLLHKIPPSLSFEEATFIEPLAAAINTFDLMPFEPEDEIIVIYGAGKLGLLIAQVAKNYNKIFPSIRKKAPTIFLVSRSNYKLKIAEKLGIDYVINSFRQDPVQLIMKLTSNIGADIVIDCTGNPDVLEQVVNSTRTRGKIGLKSTHGLPVPINMTDIVVREIALYASRCGPFDKALKFMESGFIKIENITGARFNLSNINEGVQEAKKKEIIKVIIDCEK